MNRRVLALTTILIVAMSTSCERGNPVSPDRDDARATLSPDIAESAIHRIVVHDPRNDQTGAVDVGRMVMLFRPSTGDYRIWLIAHRGHPFVGDFRININLFNADVGTTAQDPSFFSDVINDFSLDRPRRVIRLNGQNSRLTAWDAGDRIFTNNLEGTGNPDGISQFRSSVSDLPLQGFLEAEDPIAFADAARPAIVHVAVNR